MTTTTDNEARTETTGNSGTGAEAGGGRLSAATDRVRETASAARTRAADAYDAARERTGSAYSSARDSASRATQRTAEGINSNPEAAILGGLALGAILAAFLPKTERESQALGQVGRKITDTAREAARAAREAGISQLEEAGLTKEGAKQKLSDIASRATEAARTSATAAAQTVKGSGQQ
jgi:ElaB/YqjD/DUF883 family membrane-anchored ribosome-binding protein